MHTGFWWGDLVEIDYFENTGTDGRAMFFMKYGGGVKLD